MSMAWINTNKRTFGPGFASSPQVFDRETKAELGQRACY
jgi:hypothetical protein